MAGYPGSSQWGGVESSSGSGAQEVPWELPADTSGQDVFTPPAAYHTEDVFTHEDELALSVDMSHSFAGGELRQGEIMNSKIPPSFTGQYEWFKFEELVQDWVDSCVLNNHHRLLKVLQAL